MTELQSLAPYNSLGLNARALEIRKLGSTTDIHRWLDESNKFDHRLVLGGGSNVVFTRDYPGSVGIVALPGIQYLHSDERYHYVETGAGVGWHELVQWTLARDLPGLENLALIPGSAGAAPMQNIGAYGVELARRFDSLEAVELGSGKTIRFDVQDCKFGYRDSIFKHQPDRWLITRITLKLPKRWEAVLEYAGLREALEAAGRNTPDAQQVADAVCRIRRSKLPDPEKIGNVGSFFKNPVVSEQALDRLQHDFPGIPHWHFDGGVKLSAGWLIEQAGWKGKRRGAAGVHENHALVLVNHGGARGSDVWKLAREIRNAVEQRFGITLEPEPRIL